MRGHEVWGRAVTVDGEIVGEVNDLPWFVS